MERRQADVLKVILEKDNPRYHEIVAEIITNSSWNLDKSSTKVTVSNILRPLLKEYLEKVTHGHADVRYRFKNKIAKEKARLLVFSQSAQELKEALHDIVEVDPGAIESPLVLSTLVTIALGCYFSRTKRTERIENLRFYKKRGLEIMNTLYDTFFDFCEDGKFGEGSWFGDENDSILDDGYFAKFIPHGKEERAESKSLLMKVMSIEGLAELLKKKSELMKKRTIYVVPQEVKTRAEFHLMRNAVKE